jgi:L-iditol 2-dehydrogenase
MKHLTCSSTGIVELSDVAAPVLGPGEILVQMSACGVCGTDLMKVYDADTPKPVQLGHEIVGVIADVGPGVAQFQKGQRVAVAHHAPDVTSHYTTRGSATQDPQFKSSNVSPGGFAEFIRVPADLVPYTVVPVPDDVPDLRAAFMEPLACCLRALDRVKVQAGDTVLLVGVGAIGILFLPLLRMGGATTIVADLRVERLDAAKDWGATATGIVGRDDIPTRVKQHSAGRGADLVILTASNAATLDLALASVRDGGTIIPFGVKPGLMPPFDFWQIYRREISVVTSYSATPDGLTRAMALLARDDFVLEQTISHVLPLVDAAHGFALLHDMRAAKVVITAP